MRSKKSIAATMKVYKSKKDENRIAGLIGGQRLPASGAMVSSFDGKSARADLRTARFWVEQKSTDEGSISVLTSWLRKVWEGSQVVAKIPALSVTLRAVKKDYVLLPLDAYLGLGQPAPVAATRVVRAGSFMVAPSLLTGDSLAICCCALNPLSYALDEVLPPETWVLIRLSTFQELQG